MPGYVSGQKGYTFSKSVRFPTSNGTKRMMARTSKSQNSKTRPDRTGNHKIRARKKKPVRIEPRCPEEDVNNRYKWCGVNTQTGSVIIAPEGFRLTGAMLESSHHMWARKLLSSNHQ